MPFVPDNSGQQTSDLIQLLSLVKQNKQRKFANIMNIAQPGDTFQQLGVSPEQYQEATGTALQPGQEAKGQSAQDVVDTNAKDWIKSLKADPSIIDKAPTSAVLAAFNNARVAQILGLSADTTPASLIEQQKTGVVKAQTAGTAAGVQNDLVTAGSEAWKTADAKTRGQAGQLLLTGTTTSGLQSQESAQLLDIGMKRQALKMVSDPNNPSWAPIKSLGINPVLAVTAAATGMTNLLDTYARITEETKLQKSATETALAKANAEWATKVSEATGGKLSPATITAAMNAKMSGSKIADSPQLKGIYSLIDNATEASYKAILMDAYAKGNPQARALPEIIKLVMSKTDPDQFNIAANALDVVTSEAIATQALGTPRPMLAGPARDQWDALAARYKTMLPTDKHWYNKLNDWGATDIPHVFGGAAGGAGTSAQPFSLPQTSTAPTPSGGGIPAPAGAPSAPGVGAGPVAGPGVQPNLAAPPAGPKRPSFNDLPPEQQAAFQSIFTLVPGLIPTPPATPGAPPPGQ